MVARADAAMGPMARWDYVSTFGYWNMMSMAYPLQELPRCHFQWLCLVDERAVYCFLVLLEGVAQKSRAN